MQQGLPVVGELVFSVDQYIADISNIQGLARILFYNENSDASFLDFENAVEKFVHDDGGDASRRLIEHQHIWLSHQSTAHRHLLALAAGRVADAVFLVPALIILMREFLVSGLREHLAGEEVVVPVSLAAKWKTAIQMVALGCLIGAPVLAGDTRMMAETAGLVLLWVAAALTVQTGILYFRAGARYL